MKLEPTIDDVAQAASVSRATVSRVMNNNPAVKLKTADHIREVMKEIGYTPSPNRPGPKPGGNHHSRLRSQTIALITIGGTGHLFNEPAMANLINELQCACQVRKLSLLLEQMIDATTLPHSIATQQVGGAIVLVTERSAYRREAVANLSREVPCVHLFSPGHLIDTLDHATVNDVAVGALAFRTLDSFDCQSFALVSRENRLHEALHVRGRAFLDRVQHVNLPAVTYAGAMERGDPARIWPGDLRVLPDLDAIVDDIHKRIQPKKKQALGIFCTIDTDARNLHQALEQRDLLSSGAVRLIIAGTTQFYVGNLDPAPLLINLNFPKLIDTALERLIYRVEYQPQHFHTFLIQPTLQA